MSLWSRKKYTVNRRQSNPNPTPDHQTDSRSNSPLPRRQTRTSTAGPAPANRLSRSLIDLSDSSTPPPLPPRRIPKPTQPTPPAEPERLLWSDRSETHFQLPPPSVLPVFQRNASLRRQSRLSTNNNARLDPFVLIHFDDRRSSSSDFLNRFGHDQVLSQGIHLHPANSHQRHHSLFLPSVHGRNFVPNWVHAQQEDLPPSYDEAVRLEAAQLQINGNQSPSPSPNSTSTEISVEMEKPKRFVKETAV